MMDLKSKQQQHFLQLLALLLCFSCLLSLVASVPLSRSFEIRKQQSSPAAMGQNQVITREALNLEEVFRRMDIEANDYPGSGANNRHDPKSPGRP